jgi:pyruvate/2-oxoglutarate dehydrogenase complex dihydrolipoamide acyltransferase (E2) component
MSTERSDQYPEVSGEDAGIVPPQGAPKQEWPKKIRTLTATELDRLTIDGSGRFYWDGQLVNYEFHQAQAAQAQAAQAQAAQAQANQARAETPLDLDQHAMELLERTARELDPNAAMYASTQTEYASTQTDVATAPEPTVSQDAAPPAPQEAEVRALAATPADQLAPVSAEAPIVPSAPMVAVRRHDVLSPSRPETTRIALTGAQSIGVILIVASFAIAALGMAASGFVAVHDWGCKSGAIASGCPPIPKPPVRPDIPS